MFLSSPVLQKVGTTWKCGVLYTLRFMLEMMKRGQYKLPFTVCLTNTKKTQCSSTHCDLYFFNFKYKKWCVNISITANIWIQFIIFLTWPSWTQTAANWKGRWYRLEFKRKMLKEAQFLSNTEINVQSQGAFLWTHLCFIWKSLDLFPTIVCVFKPFHF